MRGRAVRRAAAISLVLALGAAGCASGGSGDEETVEAVDLLAAVEAAGTARLAMRIEEQGGPAGQDDEAAAVGDLWASDVEVEGVVTFGEPRSELRAHVEHGLVLPEGAVDEAGAPLRFTMDLRTIGSDTWVRLGTEGADPGPWEHHDGSEVEEPDGGSGDLFASLDPERIDPVAFVEALRAAATSFTESGDDSVRGDATTRYEVVLDQAVDGTGDWGEGIDEVEVWLDAEERLRRVRAGGAELELWDFGVAVDVEPPTDVADEGSDEPPPGFLPEVAGEWSLQAEGVTGGTSWQVHTAPGRHGEVDLTCRTLEVDDPAVPPDLLDPAEEGFSFPARGGVLATCGSGSFAFFGAMVADPAVQVLTVGWGLSGEDPALVGFVVSERFRDGGARLVVEGGAPIELDLDATGLAVWDAAGAPPVVALELDGGSVRCAVPGGAPEADDLLEPVERFGGGLAPCIRT